MVLIPNPWRRPFGLRCGASGRPASIIVRLTIYKTRTRLSGQIGVFASLRGFYASRMPFAVFSVSRKPGGTGTVLNTILWLPEASFRFFKLRMAMVPPDRSIRAGLISKSFEGRHPVKCSVSQIVRPRAGCVLATAKNAARSSAFRQKRLPELSQRLTSLKFNSIHGTCEMAG